MRKVHLPWREESKKNYGNWADKPGDSIYENQIRTGAIMRIADALEILVEKECQTFPKYQELILERDRAEKTISHLRGYITRLKNKKKS